MDRIDDGSVPARDGVREGPQREGARVEERAEEARNFLRGVGRGGDELGQVRTWSTRRPRASDGGRSASLNTSSAVGYEAARKRAATAAAMRPIANEPSATTGWGKLVTKMPPTTSAAPAHCTALTLARSTMTAMTHAKKVTEVWKMA